MAGAATTNYEPTSLMRYKFYPLPDKKEIKNYIDAPGRAKKFDNNYRSL
jgi:hypothetical protein